MASPRPNVLLILTDQQRFDTISAHLNAFEVAALAKNYEAGSGKTWRDADFTGDGLVDIFDLAKLAGGFGYVEGGSPVPEPVTLFVMAAAGLPMLLKRRRNA